MSSGGRGNGDRGGRRIKTETEIKTEKFDGSTDELSGYLFEVTGARNSNRYSRTVKEIARYAGSSSRYGADLKRTIETETVFTIPRPSKPTALNAGETDTDVIENHEVDTDIYREDI